MVDRRESLDVSVQSSSSELVNIDGRMVSEYSRGDKQPLLIRSLSRNLAINDDATPEDNTNSVRVLNTFFGVFVPVALSQFSTTIFLRLGFVVGQSGILLALVQFVLAYAILVLTVLSICAISTNGAVEGGGAYYMISRALGPELGGSIGLLFFLANIFSCAVYVSGFVEGYHRLMGITEWSSQRPATADWLLVHICIWLCCCTCLPRYLYDWLKNVRKDIHFYSSANFTKDYTNPTKERLNFFVVFAVLFSGVTGIMNGANMSGELKNPSSAIPKGTLLAVLYTFCNYIVLTFFAGASASRDLLHNDYNYLKDVNLWPPFVYIGIFAATLSAALGNLIGASRVLEALAKDDQFWIFTRPARIVTKGGNPWMAVVISWVLVQAVLLIGAMNAIAPMTTVFFMLSYAAVNVACLALELASAPNFRPTFRYFSWWTSLLGFIGCIVMIFLINAIYAAIAIAVAAILIIILFLRSLDTSWGSISQALIFHQVRKYLLMLDSRKNHVKFWRPQMLFMVSNPRQCSNIISFINDLKKSGLFILGHVKTGNLDECSYDPALSEQTHWLSLVDYLKVKAFVEVTLASSVREGLQQLVRISGLGGMKPNTICFGYYDDAEPRDTFQNIHRRKRWGFGTMETSDNHSATNYFHSMRYADEEKKISAEEYIQMIRDCIKMGKNVCLFRHFHQLDKEAIFKKKSYIDVWPVDIFQPDSASYMDNCCLFLLQLACVLHMVAGWKRHTDLRVFMCHSGNESETAVKQKKLALILHQLRIGATIVPVSWSPIIEEHYPSHLKNQVQFETPSLPDSYLEAVNRMIKTKTDNTSVVFCYLPIPQSDASKSQLYLDQMSALTNDLPPTVLVHGLNPVTSTTL